MVFSDADAEVAHNRTQAMAMKADNLTFEAAIVLLDLHNSADCVCCQADDNLTVRGRPRQRARPERLEVDVPVPYQGPGEHGWDPKFLTMSTVDLNDYVHSLGHIQPHQLAALKKLRRRIKNRVYTRQARERAAAPAAAPAEPPPPPAARMPVYDHCGGDVECTEILGFVFEQSSKPFQ